MLGWQYLCLTKTRLQKTSRNSDASIYSIQYWKPFWHNVQLVSTFAAGRVWKRGSANTIILWVLKGLRVARYKMEEIGYSKFFKYVHASGSSTWAAMAQIQISHKRSFSSLPTLLLSVSTHFWATVGWMQAAIQHLTKLVPSLRKQSKFSNLPTCTIILYSERWQFSLCGLILLVIPKWAL